MVTSAVFQAPPTLTENQLVDELNALGVYFLRGGDENPSTPKSGSVSLLTALATSEEARLRLALIPLFLRQPEFSATASIVTKKLPPSIQIGFKCYYTAAHLLQKIYRAQLKKLLGDSLPLPDLFSAELGLSAFKNPQAGLEALAKRHSVLTGQFINWLGTYKHGIQRFIKHLEQRKRWAT